MKGIVLVAVVAIAVAAACAIVFIPGSGPDVVDNSWEVENTGAKHTISYDPAGGTVAGTAQEYYFEGTYVALPDCERSGFFFEGWYRDPDCTVPIGAVTPSDTGDLSLHASWRVFSFVGTGMEMSVKGTYYNGPIANHVEGTTVQRYMTQSHGMYFLDKQSHLRYYTDSGFDESTDTSTGNWVPSPTVNRKYAGNEEVGGRLCGIWEDKTSTYWVYRNSLIMKIVDTTKRGSTEYLTTRTFDFVPDTVIQPSMKVEVPLTVNYPATIHIGDPLVLVASGEGFTGWYLNGSMVTSSDTLTIARADPYMRFEARAGDYVVLQSPDISPSSLGLSSPVDVTDFYGKTQMRFDGDFSLEPGYWMLCDESKPVSHYLEVFVEDWRTFNHTFTYGGTERSVSFDMEYSVVFMDAYKDPDSRIRNVHNETTIKRMYTPDNVYLREMASQLQELGKGLDRRGFAEMVLRCVQEMPYIPDGELNSSSDFMNYSSETLWDYGGDCEDSSILYANLMAVLGYRSCVMIFHDHAMAGVELPETLKGDETFTYDGVRYHYAETTGTDIGYWKAWKGYGTDTMRCVVAYPVVGSSAS